jgi:hypothetical protein
LEPSMRFCSTNQPQVHTRVEKEVIYTFGWDCHHFIPYCINHLVIINNNRTT